MVATSAYSLLKGTLLRPRLGALSVAEPHREPATLTISSRFAVKELFYPYFSAFICGQSCRAFVLVCVFAAN
jgi:hypothetical protein